MAQFPLKMNWEDRKEKANEIIAFLSAWGVSRGDAEAILGHASAMVREMNAEQFIRTGEQLGAFMKMMQGNRGDIPNA